MDDSTPGVSVLNRVAQGIAGYVDCGCGLIRGMLTSDDIDALVRESEQIWQRYVGDGPANLRLGIRRDRSDRPVLDRIDPVVDISEAFPMLNRDSRFT